MGQITMRDGNYVGIHHTPRQPNTSYDPIERFQRRHGQ